MEPTEAAVGLLRTVAVLLPLGSQYVPAALTKPVRWTTEAFERTLGNLAGVAAQAAGAELFRALPPIGSAKACEMEGWDGEGYRPLTRGPV